MLCVLHILLILQTRRELVTGGVPFDVAKVPFIVRLYGPSLGIGFCGGSMISNDTVLTAAHCVVNWDVNSQLYVGTFQTTTSATPDQNSDIIAVDTIIIHPSYDDDAIYDGYDVALLVLTRIPNNIDLLTTILLDDGFYWPANRVAPFRSSYVIGYGAEFYGGPQSPVLEGAHVNLYDASTCAPFLQANGFTLAPSNLCAGLDGADGCSGDSGGPLVVGINGFFVQVGIVSWGIGGSECVDVDSLYVYVVIV